MQSKIVNPVVAEWLFLNLNVKNTKIIL